MEGFFSNIVCFSPTESGLRSARPSTSRRGGSGPMDRRSGVRSQVCGGARRSHVPGKTCSFECYNTQLQLRHLRTSVAVLEVGPSL